MASEPEVLAAAKRVAEALASATSAAARLERADAERTEAMTAKQAADVKLAESQRAFLAVVRGGVEPVKTTAPSPVKKSPGPR